MPVHLTCPTCGKAFTKPPSGVGTGYCSSACKYITRVQCVCFICGKQFSRSPSGVKGKTYCSPECAHIRWPILPIEVSDDGVTAKIPLRKMDGSVKAYALIDAADAEWASQWTWGLTNNYVTRQVWGGKNGESATFYLHRELFGLTTGDGTECDHRNRNRLDNRRCNLRVTDRAGNAQNLPSLGGTSRYRGVSLFKPTGRWHAQLTVGGKNMHLGYFRTEEEAAEVARTARLKHMPLAVD